MEEDGESPWEACRREVAEETGLVVGAGRLVCVDFLRAPARPGRRGPVPVRLRRGAGGRRGERVVLQDEEIEEHRWATPDEADGLLSGPVGRRVGQALGAARHPSTWRTDGRCRGVGRLTVRARPGTSRPSTNPATCGRARSASRVEANQASGGTRSATG